MREGGKTGFTAVVCCVFFLLSIVLWPLFSSIPELATSPILCLIGALVLWASAGVGAAWGQPRVRRRAACRHAAACEAAKLLQRNGQALAVGSSNYPQLGSSTDARPRVPAMPSATPPPPPPSPCIRSQLLFPCCHALRLQAWSSS
jgi:hypothetical protein